MRALPPLLVRPIYRAKPWGGRRLASDLRRRDLPDGPVGESWEVADTDEAASVVDGGPHDGCPLREVLGARFPLLVKVLDAREPLSVQVHPDGRDGVPAKEEAWVALADGGEVALGVAPGAGAERPWMERLERRPLRGPGPDAARPPSLLHVPAGTVHAVLAGALLWEVQTPVDVTWRLDDHGRRDAAGRARPLHHAEAARVLARGPEPAGRLSPDGLTLLGHRFRVDLHPPGGTRGPAGRVAWFAAGGAVRWEDGRLPVPPARTVVLPPGPHALDSAGWILAADVR